MRPVVNCVKFWEDEPGFSFAVSLLRTTEVQKQPPVLTGKLKQRIIADLEESLTVLCK